MTAPSQPIRDAESTQTFDVLDAYASALRAGRAPDKAGLLAHSPELVSLLSCLEELNKLAEAACPAPGCVPPAALESPAEAPTIAFPELKDDRTAAALPGAPAQFGDYELLSTVGRGGMGVVYKARQKRLDRVVAIKMILSSQLASGHALDRFRAEARVAAGLRHPHILQVHEAGEVLGQHYFAMQYVDGVSLAERLRQAPPGPEETARCMLGVARAVAYLHRHAIVHRDLKPSNILLDQDGCPFVSDFGLVKMLEDGNHLTSSGAILGTPSYMAPEQAAGRQGQVGPLSDVYSLGAILYELLTGRPPFCELTPLDTLVQVLEGEAVLPRDLNPQVPRELEMICLKAMAKEPGERYASADDLADDLDRFLRGEGVQARPQNLRQRLVRWGRREPGLVSHLAALTAGAIIIQGYYHIAHPVALDLHTAIMGVLLLWALASLLCQALIRKGCWTEQVRLVWVALDAAMLTTGLILDDLFETPLVIAYGVLVVASGLWFQTGLVWFTTAVAVSGYGILVLAGAARHALAAGPHHHFIVVGGLLIVGAMVAAQVRRVRALSRYYEHRPMP